MKRLLALVTALAILPLSSAAAQQSCAPDTLAKAVDAYASEPYGVQAWRKMTGLGDPMIEAGGIYADSWQQKEDWKKLAAQVAPELTDVADPGYDCRIGYPLSVLKDRIARFGAGDPYVKQWFYGQAAVLRACSSSAAVPPAAPDLSTLKPEQAELLKHDHAYQVASVAFYADKPKAVELFKAIGASASPHRAAARYNVANLLANARNVVEARREAQAILADPSLASVHGITQELQGYISNIADTADGWSLLIDNAVAVLSKPQAEIEKSDELRQRYSAALYDLRFLGIGAKQGDWWITNTLPENPTLSKAVADAARKHDLALWSMAGQTVDQHFGQAPWTLVGPTWQAWNASLVNRALALEPAGKSLAPLPRKALAALASGSDEAARSSLWADARMAAQAATASCGDAAETGAVSALAAAAARTSVVAGKFAEAYTELKSLGIESTKLYRDVLVPRVFEAVLAAGQVEEGRRMRDALGLEQLAGSLASPDGDYLRDRYASFLAWVAEDKARWEAAVKMQSQRLSSPLLNLMSSGDLRALAAQPDWSPAQKALLARAAWTRDFARGVRPGKTATADMLALNPQIKATVDALRQEFPKIRDKDLWTLTILRNPRMGLLLNSPDWTDPIETARDDFRALDYFDHNDKNWWCPLETDRHLAAVRRDYDEASGLHAAVEYNADDLKPLLEADAVSTASALRDAAVKAHPVIQAVKWKELAQLAKAPSAPKSLSLAAVGLAKSGRLKEAAPEALGRAVQATRYGCNWAGPHGRYSKAAQDLLRRKYPESSWAKATPYWFDCVATRYDAQYNAVADCQPKSWPAQAPLR